MNQAEDITVRCSALKKAYGSGNTKVQALRGIDLEIRAGELLMLVGPSGCGKTTLISVMAGILNQDEGDCQVLGRDLNTLSPQELSAFRAVNIGFVFQAFNLLPMLSAKENIAIPLLINKVRRGKALSQASDMCRLMGLADRVTSFPPELSGGQQQRVAIARSLVHCPRLIVCDEPTSSLDHETGQMVMELLRLMAVGPGRSLVVVTHDARIFGFADRIARMDDGRIVQVETPDKILERN
ncbi:MAG: ABC transporter ATP-binding protein [Planctomycetota bacterium]